jgi:hypothetical protein
LIGQARQFCLQFLEQFLAVRPLPLFFLRVVAHRIAPPAFAIADHDFLDLQILGYTLRG